MIEHFTADREVGAGLLGRLRSTSATNTNAKIQTGACAELAIVQNEIVLEVASTVFGLKMEALER